MEQVFKAMWFRLLLGGLIRAGMGAFGGYLLGHGLIDANTHQKLLTEGVADMVGYALIGLAIVWSWLNKTKLVEKVKAAFYLPSSVPPEHISEQTKRNAPIAGRIPL